MIGPGAADALAAFIRSIGTLLGSSRRMHSDEASPASPGFRLTLGNRRWYEPGTGAPLYAARPARERRSARARLWPDEVQERMCVRLGIQHLPRAPAPGRRRVTETADNPPGTDVRRTPYRLTHPGREALSGWLREPRRCRDAAWRRRSGNAWRSSATWNGSRRATILELLRAELWALAKTVDVGATERFTSRVELKPLRFAGPCFGDAPCSSPPTSSS